jgi:hypothetical protein
MIALAGIIVRNSILLVDFIELQVKTGMAFKDAVLQSAGRRWVALAHMWSGRGRCSALCSAAPSAWRSARRGAAQSHQLIR